MSDEIVEKNDESINTIKVESVIYEDEKVSNQNRRFGSDDEYFPVIFKHRDLSEEEHLIPLLFTRNELEVAMKRAKKNMEDFPTKKPAENFAEWLFSMFSK